MLASEYLLTILEIALTANLPSRQIEGIHSYGPYAPYKYNS